jgi:hypothetical protein
LWFFNYLFMLLLIEQVWLFKANVILWFFNSLFVMILVWQLMLFKGLIELRSRNVSPNLIIPSPWLLTLLLNYFQ